MLALLTGAIVAFALARRRWRLALVAGGSITGAVATTEILKLHLLTRPDLDGTPTSCWRCLSMLAAMMFGVGVLATGWHRPSDTVGAFLVCVAWSAVRTALLIAWRGCGGEEMGTVEARLDRRLAVVSCVLVVAVVAVVLVETFSDDAVRTVESAADYLIVAVTILAIATVIVLGYNRSLRGVSLDAPRPHRSSDTATNSAISSIE